MSDFVTTSVPPLIPGDAVVRNVTVNNRAQNEKLFQVPTVTTTAALPAYASVPVGTLMLDKQAGVLKFANTSGWIAVTNT